MKRILITGKESYIGTNFKQYMEHYPEDYHVEELDVRDDSWKEYDFSSFDAVFHVAGLAHSDTGKISEELEHKYYNINTQLTLDIADRAKAMGVNQFIFMSSIIVYGESAPVYRSKVINEKTLAKPKNAYGDSKLQADLALLLKQDLKFRICILRPPMIYGQNCKGNYKLLSKIAKTTRVFPSIQNERSMLYIENLCFFIKCCIEKVNSGIFYPQNKEYISTAKLVKEIAKNNGKDIHLTKLLNPIVRLASHIPGKIGKLTNKAFGNLTYEKRDVIDVVSFSESVQKTEVL